MLEATRVEHSRGSGDAVRRQSPDTRLLKPKKTRQRAGYPCTNAVCMRSARPTPPFAAGHRLPRVTPTRTNRIRPSAL